MAASNRYRAIPCGTRTPGRDRVVKMLAKLIDQFAASAGAWRGSSDWISGHPEQIAGWLEEDAILKDRYNQVSPRDHLSQPVCPSARRAQERAALPFFDQKRSMRSLARPVDPNGDRRGHRGDTVSIRSA